MDVSKTSPEQWSFLQKTGKTENNSWTIVALFGLLVHRQRRNGGSTFLDLKYLQTGASYQQKQDHWPHDRDGKEEEEGTCKTSHTQIKTLFLLSNINAVKRRVSARVTQTIPHFLDFLD